MSTLPCWIYPGAICRSRDGRKIHIAAVIDISKNAPREFQPVIGWAEGDTGTRTWDSDGSWFGPSSGPANSDLVGPWREPYVPKAGDIAKTSGGAQVLVFAHDCPPDPYGRTVVGRFRPSDRTGKGWVDAWKPDGSSIDNLAANDLIEKIGAWK